MNAVEDGSPDYFRDMRRALDGLTKAAPSPDWLRKKARELLALANAIEFHDMTLRIEGLNARPEMALVDSIVEAVCISFRVSIVKLRSNNRTQHIALARQVAMFLIRKNTTFSFPIIGRLLKRDHSTVIHAFNLIGGRALTDPAFATFLDRVTALAIGNADAAQAAQAAQTAAEEVAA